jgi:hypothetical protein
MTDEQKIHACVLDYVEGWYSADGARMERALHDGLAKRRITPENEIWGVDKAWMVEETGRGRGKIEKPDLGKKEIAILDRTERMASVRLVSNEFTDYLHLVKTGEDWRIANALWDY